MPDSLEYLTFWHEKIEKEGQEALTSCVAQAIELYDILTQENKSPYIMQVYEIDEETLGPKGLLPLAFEGKGIPKPRHWVCCSDDLAYDPLVGEPIALENYCKTIFGRDYEMQRIDSEKRERVREMLR